MKRNAIAVVLTLMVAACHPGGREPTGTPAIKAAGDQARTALKECKEQHRNGRLTLMQSVQCSNPRIVADFDGAHYPYMDLIRFGMAARLAGAERVDKGEISEAEYDRQLAELRGRVADEIDRRNAAAMSVNRQAPPPAQTETLDAATEARLLRGLGAFGRLMR